MPLIFNKPKNGASKSFYQTIKSELRVKNILLIGSGVVLGCLLTVIFFYYAKFDSDNGKSLLVDNPKTHQTNNLESITRMPEFNFYNYLPENTVANFTQTATKTLDNDTNNLNSYIDKLEKIQQPLISDEVKTVKKCVAYSLQIGLFLHLKQAQATLAKVESLGFIAIIEKVRIKSKKEWFRIEVGPFFSLKDFNYAQNKILEQNIDGVLLQCRQKNYIK